MRCTGCGAVNHPGRVYCGGCAARLVRPCPACQFMNTPEDRYCGGCAGDLCASAGAAPAASAPACALPAPGDREAPTGAGVFDGLDDLLDDPGPAAEPSRASVAEMTQADVDGFFRRLVSEGAAEIKPAAGPARAPGAPGKEAS